MPVSAVLLVLFAFGASFVLVGAAFRLKENHQARYLDHYFHFVLAIAAYGLVNWVGPFLALEISDGQLEADAKWIAGTFVLFATPLLFVQVGFFLLLFQDMRMREAKPWTRPAFLIFAAAIIVVMLMLVKGFLDTGDMTTLRGFMLGLGIAIIAAKLAIISQFIFDAHKHKTLAIGDASASFGWLYFGGYVVYAACAWSPLFAAPGVLFEVTPWLFYLIHAGPLFVLWRFHQRTTPLPTAEPVEEKQDLQRSMDGFDLTKRELEILTLVISGKINQDIATALFISPNTVRNHIYNIYKKLGVKNRLQLVALCVAPKT